MLVNKNESVWELHANGVQNVNTKSYIRSVYMYMYKCVVSKMN